MLNHVHLQANYVKSCHKYEPFVCPAVGIVQNHNLRDRINVLCNCQLFYVLYSYRELMSYVTVSCFIQLSFR